MRFGSVCSGIEAASVAWEPNQMTGLSCQGGEGMAGATVELRGDVSMATDTLAVTDLESDPSSLASQAAVELDNLLRARRDDVPAVQRLGELIKEEFSGQSHRATTVGVMKRAINASGVSATSLAKVEDVQKGATHVADVLIRIASDAVKHRDTNPEELKKMRAFCVAFSIQRSATDRPRSGKPQHPYRR